MGVEADDEVANAIAAENAAAKAAANDAGDKETVA